VPTIEPIINHLSAISKEIVQRDKLTLEEQGHKDTGRLERSLKFQILTRPGGVTVHFKSLDYGLGLSTGLTPNEINYSFSDIVDWARRKHPGKSDEQINQFIFLMMRAHKREGMPTEGSKRFSKTGVRTGWIPIGTEYAETLLDNNFDLDDYIEQILDEAFADFVD